MKKNQGLIDNGLLYRIERLGNSYHFEPLNDPYSQVNTIHIKALKKCEMILKEINIDFDGFIKENFMYHQHGDCRHPEVDATYRIPLDDNEEYILSVNVKNKNVDSFRIQCKRFEHIEI